MFTLPLERDSLMGGDHATKMVNCKVMPKTLTLPSPSVSLEDRSPNRTR